MRLVKRLQRCALVCTAAAALLYAARISIILFRLLFCMSALLVCMIALRPESLLMVPDDDEIFEFGSDAQPKLDPSRLMVPNILHQTYKTEDIPEEWRNAQAYCRELHQDYKYMFWTDDSARAFVAANYSWFLRTYDSYPNNIQRVDAVRYLLLHHFGGVYLDLDVGCRGWSLDRLRQYPMVLPLTAPLGFSNDVMVSVPGHPLLEQMIHALHSWNHVYGTKYPTVMFSTGPVFLDLQFLLYRWRGPRRGGHPTKDHGTKNHNTKGHADQEVRAVGRRTIIRLPMSSRKGLGEDSWMVQPPGLQPSPQPARIDLSQNTAAPRPIRKVASEAGTLQKQQDILAPGGASRGKALPPDATLATRSESESIGLHPADLVGGHSTRSTKTGPAGRDLERPGMGEGAGGNTLGHGDGPRKHVLGNFAPLGGATEPGGGRLLSGQGQNDDKVARMAAFNVKIVNTGEVWALPDALYGHNWKSFFVHYKGCSWHGYDSVLVFWLWHHLLAVLIVLGAVAAVALLGYAVRARRWVRKSKAGRKQQ